MGSSDASAFDGLANGYDGTFTHTGVGSVLRAMVWRRLEAVLPPRASVLELGCGTGEDAIWLAQTGHRVVALDASAEMVRLARLKAAAAGCARNIEFHCLPMESLDSLPPHAPFDAVLSNFGAINCVPDLSALASMLATRLAPGATLMFAVMGRHVPWEWAWFLAHGEGGKAFRRLRRGGVVWRGIRVRYPAARELAEELRPHFTVSRVSALGSVLPPGYAAAWLERSPRALRLLSGLERRLAGYRVFAALADHYLFEARRTPEISSPSLLERPPRRLWRRVGKRVIDLACLLSGQRRYDDYRLERVADLRLLVLPSVSNPRVLRTGEFFAKQLAKIPIGPRTRVLDLGTGSGVCALQAARRSSAVVAVDINEAAVRCTRVNAALNRLEQNVDVRCGDLFGPVRGERFDVVLFNPPFYGGTPRDAREAAWRGADLPARFARELDAHLGPDGEALVLLSSAGDACPVFESELRRHAFALSVFAVHRHVGEIVTILRVRRT